MYWPFAMHPELAVVIALFFLVGSAIARRIHGSSKWLITASCLWFVYAAWEQYCTAGTYNIRVDLIILPIFLLSASAIALVATATQVRRHEQ
jgi:hypothetical protein